MDALGMIETKGLLPAIECADVMVKAAQVTLLCRTMVGGGLVTICVSGDVGAVQAAVEAGAAAVEHLNPDLLISRHIIPRPHAELEAAMFDFPDVESNEASSTPDNKPEAIPVDEEIEQMEMLDIDKQELMAMHKDDIDDLVFQYGAEPVIVQLNKLPVVALRHLAREYTHIGLVGRELSRANKVTLLGLLTAYYGEEK